jgi:tRNA (adenine37-N6)-methyltransferase
MDIGPSDQLLTVRPIGILLSSAKTKFQLPHQPSLDAPEVDTIELYPHNNYEVCLRDLEGFEYIWLLWWFHKNMHWKPLVRPPRGEEKKRGVFATRSPHRPNPLGISVLRLIKIKGRVLTVGSGDLLDGTPILDIKPYIPTIDAFPNAAYGWVEALEKEMTSPPQYTVALSPLAEEQHSWFQSKKLNFFEKAFEILERNPTPNRTRRITLFKDGSYRMGCGGWRIFYTVQNTAVYITHFSSGYPARILNNITKEPLHEHEELLEFHKIWP